MSEEAGISTKKRKVVAASAVEKTSLSLQRLSSNPDAMKMLGQFLCPSSMHSMPLNEHRRPCLFLSPSSMTVVSFVEKCNQPGLWRVSTYMTYFNSHSYFHPDVEFHCQPASQSTADFLKALIKRIFAYQKSTTTDRSPALRVYFAEARSLADYRDFLSAYKKRLPSWDKLSWGMAEAKVSFCRLFDGMFPLREFCGMETDALLALMQWKFSIRKCLIGHWFLFPEDKLPKRNKTERVEQMESLTRTLESFEKFMAGDFCLQPPLTKRLSVLERRYPCSLWRERILSNYSDLE
jgi:hypothetical protein